MFWYLDDARLIKGGETHLSEIRKEICGRAERSEARLEAELIVIILQVLLGRNLKTELGEVRCLCNEVLQYSSKPH